MRFLRITLVIAAATLGSGASGSRVYAVFIKFGGGAAIQVANVEPGRTVLAFGAQENPGGRSWDTTAGSVILDLVAGPKKGKFDTTLSATLTLTGSAGPDEVFGTADDHPFDVLFDPAGGTAGGVGNNVLIEFGSGAFNFIPIPVFDSASLDGSIHTKGGDLLFGTGDDPPLPDKGTPPVDTPAPEGGVILDARDDAVSFGTIGEFNAVAVFSDAIGPIRNLGSTVSISGIITFSFDPAVHLGGNAGLDGVPGNEDDLRADRVRFPESAVVRAVTPEPSSLIIWCIGAVGLFGCGWRRRKLTRR